jgi:hypothetical protein
LGSKVTGSFGITAAGVREQESEPLVDIIVLRTTISARIWPEVLHVTLTVQHLSRLK